MSGSAARWFARLGPMLGVLVTLLAGPGAAEAQYFNFGQNKIQYRRLDWRILRGEHVDLYYYPAEADLAPAALAYAEASYDTLAIQFGLQCAINLAVNLNLIPPKGMTLPFVSYGGTSTIAIAFGMGLMLALTRKRPEERMATGLPAYRPSATVVPAE